NPVLLAMLGDGRLHLTAIAKLAPHLTAENRNDLLKRATHRSKRQIEELIAELRPRPDAPALMHKLPAGHVPLPGSGRGVEHQTESAVPLLRPDAVEAPAPPAPAVVDPLA